MGNFIVKNAAWLARLTRKSAPYGLFRDFAKDIHEELAQRFSTDIPSFKNAFSGLGVAVRYEVRLTPN